MQVLNDRDFTSFKTLAQMNQPKLFKTVYRMLKNIYPKDQIIINTSGIIAKGNIPICLVAHLDTVFPDPPKEIFYDRQANVIWSPQGLGADDRAGVFSIFKILAAGYLPHVVFTTDEERGGIGASEMANHPCPFDELKFIIELDRANSIDCVFYEGANYEFEDFIESYGFVTALGTYSDIVELCPAWEVSGVNLSIGYRDEHSYSEILFVGQMLSTIQKVIKILSTPDLKKYPFISEFGKHNCRCVKCGIYGTTYNMIPVTVDKLGHKSWMCGDCLTEENVEWCITCGEAFLPDLLNKDKICKQCEEDYNSGVMNNGSITYDISKYSAASKQSNRAQSAFYPYYDDFDD